MQTKIVAFYGSPRREGNTAQLLGQAVAGAQEAGVSVEEIWLRDLAMSPCLELYGCKEKGRCVINDDFQAVYDKISDAHGIMVASPIFFYSVSAHTKILMDRCQSFWVKKNWLDPSSARQHIVMKKGLFISAGATKGKRLFDGALLAIHYFYEAIDTELWASLLYRRLDFADDILKHPEYLEEAYSTGKKFGKAVLRNI